MGAQAARGPEEASMAFGVQTLGRVLALTLTFGLADPGFAQDDTLPDLAGIYDLEGQTVVGETKARFVVTGKLEGKQHFAACVRNMFEEERGASPGLLAIDGGSRWWS